MTSLPIIDLPVAADAAPTASPSGNPGAKGTYAFVSLGCPKNLVDSERMLGLLQLDGYRLVHDPVGTDFVVVNTCGFIERARQESYGAIREMLELKRQGQTRGVIVSGCLAEREKESLLEACPGVDRLVGVFGREHVSKMADRLFGNLDEQRSVFQPAPSTPLPDRQRLRITPRHFAYLKISEGCNRLCTFCAIPKMRGKHHTKPIEEVIAEAKELAADGVRELNIVAQDTTYYGIDLYGKPRLAELLQRLNEIDGLDWIRLLYLYPEHFTDELIDVLAGQNKILAYLDIPLQHINDTVLRRMQRRVNRAQTDALLDRLQDRIPDLVLRTTFITGFPGETDEQYNDLLRFVAERGFQRLGVFTYSLEPDTPAARLDGHLPEKVKERRRERLMRAQQEIAFAWNRKQIGKRRDVLLDSPVPNEADVWIGRTFAEAPDIDGVVYVTGPGLAAGQIVPCEIVATSEYDLVAAAIGEPR
jgi:ribosomal protein S12 methylthiotransferase